MTIEELKKALRGLKVETGSLVCLGCRHSDRCGTNGCAIIKAAIEKLEKEQ